MVKERSKKEKNSTISDIALLRLRRWNNWSAVINAAEGIVIVVLAGGYSVPVIANYLSANPISSAVAGHSVLSSSTHPLSQVNPVTIIVAFFLVAVIARILASTVYRNQYEAGLRGNVSKIRWIEYAVSSGLALLLIALLSGVYDIASLLMIFVFAVIAGMLGLLVERHGASGLASYWLGVVAGFLPWLVFGIYAFSASYYGGTHIPAYVYGIYATMFICTILTWLSVYLTHKKQGRWASYLYSEQVFIVLSLVTKTFLAWQVFVGILRP